MLWKGDVMEISLEGTYKQVVQKRTKVKAIEETIANEKEAWEKNNNEMRGKASWSYEENNSKDERENTLESEDETKMVRWKKLRFSQSRERHRAAQWRKPGEKTEGAALQTKVSMKNE